MSKGDSTGSGNGSGSEVQAGHASPEAMLAGMRYAFRFAIFNGLSSQVILGSPMVLYAKSLGASATVLGLIAGMMPALVILQIPAAQNVLRTGYKRFMLAGWTTRTVFVFVMALLPVAGGFLDAPTRLILIIALLFLYNLSRGISSGAWLPWITELVPAHLRGTYMTREQWCVNLAGSVAFGLSAALLGRSALPWQYALVFAVSGAMGWLSLEFLKRMPDVAVPPEEASARGPVPWLELSRFEPFRKILIGNIAWGLAYGGLQTFIVSYLRAQGGLGDAAVLIAMAAFYLGGMSATWVAGPRMDRLGSKPVLTFTMVMLALMSIGWFLMAARVIPAGQASALALLLVLGLGSTLFTSAQYRLAMVTIPKMGRSHFFALFSVVLNVTLGVSPFLWGLVIDAVGPRTADLLGMQWNKYSVFFALVTVCYGWVLTRVRGLDEKTAAPVEDLLQELLVKEPKRVLSRFQLGK